MKHLIYILLIAVLTVTCQKSDIAKNDYVGNWQFEVEYLSYKNDMTRSTITNCIGNIQNADLPQELNINYCINDWVKVKYDSKGNLFQNNQKIGEISDSYCELNLTYDSLAPIQNVYIIGNRKD